ncbi:hypothetical protein IJ670_08630 [bacterium]|nr:hypothetical protein [bacterium]
MLNLLTKKKQYKPNFSASELSTIIAKLTQIYNVEEISKERMNYFISTFDKYGYLPYPQFKVLEELTDAEALFCLILKLNNAKTFVNSRFIPFTNPSVLERLGIKNSSWFKKEGHNIKLLSLSALSKGNETGHFMDWIKCLITLPSGCEANNILPTTIYLIPFFEREFECAYLPKSSEVSSKLQDDNLLKFLRLDKTQQVKLFIQLAQLCNHPVIYDILPQTSRFSKAVLAHPEIARWIDVNELISNITGYLNALCAQMMQEGRYKDEEILTVQKLYLNNMQGNPKKYSPKEQEIVDILEEELREYKILVSYKMSFSQKQLELQKRAKGLIDAVAGQRIEKESDILNHDEIIDALIKEGLWTNCGGAWCSSGVPVFDKMAKNRRYPIYLHYNFKGEDVTKFANLDCQTPYFFYHFETNKYNDKVIDYFVNSMQNLQVESNFDGFRIDHIDHIVDEVSQDKKGQPISYRIPSKVLAKLNSTMKKKIPYFATLAEYMLWDEYFKEYHQDMKFDLLWGDDIVAQSSKTPEQIMDDNFRLSKYNQKNAKKIKENKLSILKGYNNQDGEFRDINQYPGQLGEEGALFKWFKMKFIPGGSLASRPVLLVDGDESFTKTGIEHIISKEVSMQRNYNWAFWEKFNAIDFFASHDSLLNNAKAELIEQDTNGFCAWKIVAEDKNYDYSYLVVANYLAPTELKNVYDKDGSCKKKVVKGTITRENTVKIPRGKKLVSYYEFELDEMQKCMLVEKPLMEPIKKEIVFHELKPSEFKIYKMM